MKIMIEDAIEHSKNPRRLTSGRPHRCYSQSQGHQGAEAAGNSHHAQNHSPHRDKDALKLGKGETLLQDTHRVDTDQVSDV
jgi:hypothetical protein